MAREVYSEKPIKTHHLKRDNIETTNLVDHNIEDERIYHSLLVDDLKKNPLSQEGKEIDKSAKNLGLTEYTGEYARSLNENGQELANQLVNLVVEVFSDLHTEQYENGGYTTEKDCSIALNDAWQKIYKKISWPDGISTPISYSNFFAYTNKILLHRGYKIDNIQKKVSDRYYNFISLAPIISTYASDVKAFDSDKTKKYPVFFLGEDLFEKSYNNGRRS